MILLCMKKCLCFIFFVFIMTTLQASLPSISAGSEAKADIKPADSKGCPLMLLKDREYFHALSERIQAARTQIVMAFFLFKTNGHPKNYPEIILRELGHAARRGVRVILVLEQDEKPDATVSRDNRSASERLKATGVEIYFDSPKKTTHAKLAVIDGRYTFIGSHNLTQSALKYNNELSVLIDSPTVADQTLKYIKGLY